MRKILFLSLIQILYIQLYAQTPYTSYFTGDTSDVITNTLGGLCLMGGATENDSAMKWLLKRCGGGDVLVIRASGADGYNTYLYSDLGVNVNSVETLVLPSVAAATHPYVIQRLREAELVWIAGGNQFDYVSFWKDNIFETTLNDLIQNKNIPIGGTSAGMAVLGDAYFSAANNTVTSATALANPYDIKVDLGYHDFIHHPLLTRVITDTHYDNPDRRGRQTVFLARLFQDNGFRFLGIACEEYTAVCIDPIGNAKIFGDYPAYDDFAYFLVPSCLPSNTPETCTNNTPLTWDRAGKALYVCKIGGTPNGNHTFNLNDWETQSGGTWENWFVQNGVLQTTSGVAHDCNGITALDISDTDSPKIAPNPCTDYIEIKWNEGLPVYYNIYDMKGECVASHQGETSSHKIYLNNSRYAPSDKKY